MRARPTEQPMTDEACRAALGVGPNAGDDELRRAYRRQLRRCHPDLNGGNHDRREELARAQQAFRTLERRLRGLDLHEMPPLVKRTAGRPRETPVPRERNEADRRALRENFYQIWRQFGLLPLLTACIAGALMLTRGGEGSQPHAARPALFLGAMAAAAALYGAGLALLGWWRR